MAEYLVKEESLVSVADAIRAKIGGADLLTFPDGLIEAITNFGINLTGISEIDAGTYTPTADETSQFDMPVNFSDKPYVAIVVTTGVMHASTSYLLYEVTVNCRAYSYFPFCGYAAATTTSSAGGNFGEKLGYLYEGGFKFNRGSKRLQAGTTYLWIAFTLGNI